MDLLKRLLFVLVGFHLLCPPIGEAWADGLRLCAEDWPPYEYYVEEKPKGLSYEVLSSVLRRMGEPVAENVNVSWLRGLEAIQEGSMDILYSALRTPEREVYAYYPSEPLAVSSWVFFSSSFDKKDSYADWPDFKGKTVGIVDGYDYPDSFLKRVRKEGRLEKRVLSIDNIRMLGSGRIDYAVEELRVGNRLVRRLGMQGKVFPLLKVVLARRPVFAMFSKKTVSEDFVRRFSDELVRFKQTPEYQEILSKYR
ncbi:transporter substrate-binding domain-containing protein [uncultured Pseudodesulfovibrio sp.]|uniref:substrate-binding periplasmic protein n=1 Tax=uncultured Pseudodesulfovibrio sp. TaxID=2035858 RepID=UPI0029C82C4A|nr:transporter substrate-binding domain-containing protein [uncultured Pseudodesulfovibrio sp.]